MTRKRQVDVFPVAHVTFKIIDCPHNGKTFSLIAGYGELPERKNTLFSGHIHKGMSSELHRLAAHISTLEAKLDEEKDIFG